MATAPFLDTTPVPVSYGAKGPAVVSLQLNLQKWGFPPGKLDGIYGPTTRAAVTALQKFMGLSSDGIFGPNTVAAVLRDIAGGSTSSRLLTMYERRPTVVVPVATTQAPPIITDTGVSPNQEVPYTTASSGGGSKVALMAALGLGGLFFMFRKPQLKPLAGINTRRRRNRRR
jgi:peptidoglycan hydrolase-like protein with peptidoglycan-binding domain